MTYNPDLLNGVPQLSPKQLYLQAVYTIAKIMNSEYASASAAGKAKVHLQLETLFKARDEFYRQAVNAGEIIENPYFNPPISDISMTD